MNVTHDMSVLSLITGASVLVQLVMGGLVLASLLSWYYIFIKIFTYKRAAKQTAKFERDFWGGGDLNELFQRAVNARDSSGSLERIYEAGFREFTKLRKQPGQNIGVVMDGTRRAMRATYQR
jgi:biopolymer transport protein TolQ